MRFSKERRSHKRHPYTQPIAYICWCSEGVHSDDAIMVNYSKDGMGFESSMALAPGTNLYLQMNGNSPERLRIQNEGLYPVVLGEVKWCTKNVNHNGSYQVGVKYHPNKMQSPLFCIQQE